ncbi:hypothetical protein JKP88DRAFT_304500 [Tribonema minus]|uniref:F-box domain-containing protein n=1 Tax=Tribonema minus TaxID=303371 RepID=A0A835ZDW3_9STRA|nr:hypothetical protein JKP88DRAFT_304500 [Tribonema minus]
MAPCNPAALRQLPLTDLPDHILEHIVSCASLTSLGRLEGCHRTLAPYCENAPQWALGVAAFNTVNRTADGEDEYRTVGLIPFMDALRALDPRTSTEFATLSPRQQFHELMQFNAKCTGNLSAALGHYMAHTGEGGSRRFGTFMANITGHPVWHFLPPPSPRCDALEALAAADAEAFHRMLDLTFLSSARDELARGPREFARLFAGMPFLPEPGMAVRMTDALGAAAPSRSEPFPHTSSPQDCFDSFYVNTVTQNLDKRFSIRSPEEMWVDEEGVVLGSERHMERLLEPVGPAALFGDTLSKSLDCVCACSSSLVSRSGGR